MQETIAGPLFLLNTTQAQTDNIPDEEDWRYWNYLQNLISKIRKITTEAGKLSSVLEAVELTIYDKNRKILAIYRGSSNGEVLGMYLPVHGGTFVPINTAEDTSGAWMGIEDIPQTPLPANTARMYQNEIPSSTTAKLSTPGQKTTMEFITPIVHNADFQGICVIHIPIRQSDVARYSRFSQTDVNIFTGDALSVGTLSEYNRLSFTESTNFHSPDILNLEGMPPVEFSTVTIENQAFYQGSVVLRDLLDSSMILREMKMATNSGPGNPQKPIR